MSCDHIVKPSCEQIINILPDPFVVIDRQYRIIAANNNYRKRYGFDRGMDDVVGRYCYEVSHHLSSPCSQHGEHCPLETVFSTAQAAQVMHVHYDRAGREEYVQLHSTPLLDGNGNVLYVGEYIFPLTQRRQDDLLIGRSRPMLRMTSLLQRVPPTSTTVLLLGESGVGKDLVARAIHQHSRRVNGPFIKINCTAIPENLLESELFGYEKGAFTGATTAKPGKFELADKGTIFLDEIGDMPGS